MPQWFNDDRNTDRFVRPRRARRSSIGASLAAPSKVNVALTLNIANLIAILIYTDYRNSYVTSTFDDVFIFVLGKISDHSANHNQRTILHLQFSTSHLENHAFIRWPSL